jgi:Zn-dependent protease with chaperone function
MDGSMMYMLGWTLVHFVWQGALVALVLAATNWYLGREAAQGRYVAACVALGLLVLAPLLSYWHLYAEWSAFEAHLFVVNKTAGFGMSLDQEVVTPVSLTGTERSWWYRVYWEAGLPWLVRAWMLGAMVFAARMVGGWLRLQWIKKNADPAAGQWQARCNELRRSLYISRSVHLLESAKVAVPLTLGWIRPVILLPVGLLSGLPVQQVEAVLLHEMAHIRRYDYLVNLVQSLVEVLFFYHPAVWWISACLRREREFCCDALASRSKGDGADYGRSLLALEEWVQGAGMALAPGATDGVLLERVQRLAGVQAPRRSIDIRRVLLVGPLLLVMGASLVAMENRAAEYQAETVLLYKANSTEDGKNDPAGIDRALAMVLLQGNLEEVKQRLEIDMDTEDFRDIFEVEIKPNTSLLALKARWPDDNKAAEIVNTLREVFLNNQRVIRRSLIGIKVRDVEEKLQGVKREYTLAVKALEKFRVEQGDVHLEGDRDAHLQRLGALGKLEKLIEIEVEYLEENLVDLNQLVADISSQLESLPPAPDWDQSLTTSQIRLQVLGNTLRAGKHPQEVLYEPILETTGDLLEAVKAEKLRQQKNYSSMPGLQGEYEELRDLMGFWKAQRNELEQQLASTRRSYQSNLSEYTLIREARVPTKALD